MARAASKPQTKEQGLVIERRFTSPDTHPYDELEWELRDALIGDPEKPAFEQRGVEFPTSWSQNATNIVAQKYFRGQPGSDERESSVRQMVDRVAGRIASAGREAGYFASDAHADTFEAELTHILVNQKAAFNSPVWFNVGWRKPGEEQASACFILSVEDEMESILDWNTKEGIIFKGGSGSGINLSKIRGSMEPLAKGGIASGPVSFMRGADSWAGAIKSGGGTRRAAKMVVLDVDHPDVEDFIRCKAVEEEKANALKEAGFDMRLDSDAFTSVQFQNANNSVRVTDEFMQAVEDDTDWDLVGRVSGKPVKTVKARDLMQQIADAAWRCADPGVQYDTTINRWHTDPNTGPITASNPCFPGDARVHTTLGLLSFEELYERASAGDGFRVYTHRATAGEPGDGVVATEPLAVMRNGVKPILRLRFSNGQDLRCTPNHRLWTRNRGYVPAEELTERDDVLLNDSPTQASDASWELPAKVTAEARSYKRGGTLIHQALPERWSEGLAELTGHLIGDGCLTGTQTQWVYGGDDIDDGLAGSHEGMLRELIGGVSRQEMNNGTVQLRAGSEAVRKLFRGIGVTSARAHDKRVPSAVHTAPPEVQAAFLRGLFGADGCVSRTENGKASRYVGLGSRSQALVKGAQRLLNSFGIRGRIYNMKADQDRFSYTRSDGTEITYRSRDWFDLRVTGSDLEKFAVQIGFSTPRKERALDALLGETGRYATKATVRLTSSEEDGQEYVYNLTEPLHHSYIVDGVVVANCSEYMSIDDSACNLASLNLMKFRNEDGSFNVADYVHAVDVVFLAQEILVGFSSYPTEQITHNARAFRQLGLGYANLGAMLMADGVPYDSDQGRATAAAVTALMTGRGYRMSAQVAETMGPYGGYAENREPHNQVMRMHQAAAYEVSDELVEEPLLHAARESWDEAVALGEEHGYRNAQATVLAPTGTISFLMDCDTTGIEPDFSLVKFKELVGGGQMTIVNKTVPMALRTLGYSESEVEQIEAYIADKSTIIGAPGLKDEHLEVFDVAVGERSISHTGHIEMMAATQPFLSGAISKCVVGETLISTADGLVRIESLHRGEDEDSFREMELELASLDGIRSTNAFYYGGPRETVEVTLRSGHRVTGTPNHRVLVASNEGEPRWKQLDELESGDYVATQYGNDLWAQQPPSLGFVESQPYGSQKKLTLPERMTGELAFFLGAYAAEGHTSRSNYTAHISNADDEVLDRLARTVRRVFDIEPRVVRPVDRCPSVVISSKTLVEFMDHLGCGDRAANKRIPDAVLGSPRSMVLDFLAGLSLDSYLPSSIAKWAICLDSKGLLDDLQAVLTNLGIVHSRITKWNAEYDKSFDEVYAHGRHAQRLAGMLAFAEHHKRVRALELIAQDLGCSQAGVVPGIDGWDLYQRLPRGTTGRSGRGTGHSREFSHLKDPRTQHVSRDSLERVATVLGVELDEWMETVLDQNLHFSPVESVADAGMREVYDVSVPVTHAFVGNGVVNHNTVNLPETATVDDIADAYIYGWKQGLKALAIYRDGSKTAQALRTDAQDSKSEDADEGAAREPVRRKMPRERQSITHKFSIAGHEGYITAGKYEDDSLGEIFLTDIGKEGSTLRGMMNAFATAISIGLQYGVPLDVFVNKFSYMRFDPEGITRNPEIPFAKSMPDYIMRWLASRFIDDTWAHEDLGILTEEVRARQDAQQAFPVDDGSKPSNGESNGHSGSNGGGNGSPQAKASTGESKPAAKALTDTPPVRPARMLGQDLGPACDQCGGMMQRTGSCYTCTSCGNNTGCG
ncbi:MAG: hypothetical protein EXQ70_09645 [Solirubrobacterales bacterium]|nr:hypothetical protein [Solirubrobacterales bacterium]